MAFTMRAVKVPPNSVSLEEARTRTFEFFKSACRSIPTVMEIYNLYDVVTPSQLRSNIAAQFRKNSHITNTKVLYSSILSIIHTYIHRHVCVYNYSL